MSIIVEAYSARVVKTWAMNANRECVFLETSACARDLQRSMYVIMERLFVVGSRYEIFRVVRPWYMDIEVCATLYSAQSQQVFILPDISKIFVLAFMRYSAPYTIQASCNCLFISTHVKTSQNLTPPNYIVVKLRSTPIRELLILFEKCSESFLSRIALTRFVPSSSEEFI